MQDNPSNGVVRDEGQQNFRVPPEIGRAIDALMEARGWKKKKAKLFLGALARLVAQGPDAMVRAVSEMDHLANANEWPVLEKALKAVTPNAGTHTGSRYGIDPDPPPSASALPTRRPKPSAPTGMGDWEAVGERQDREAERKAEADRKVADKKKRNGGEGGGQSKAG